MNKITDRFYRTIQNAYDRTVRPLLPRRRVYRSDVPVRGKLLDLKSTIETKTVQSDWVMQSVEPGDRLGVVGGGWGVTAVHGARAGANTTIFEASAEQVEDIKWTVKEARIHPEACINVEQAIVGTDQSDIWGDASGAKFLAPGELPEFDVIELDCEGAEIQIVDGLTSRPKTIIAEVHPHRGAPVDEFLQALPASYSVRRAQELDPDSGRTLLDCKQTDPDS
jgi:hypothetical protein